MSDENNLLMCANCGKGEECGDLKSCAACKMVKYCSRDCQIVHRPMHKKECKKRAAELHEEALFKEHPPREDCPICMLPLPLSTNQLAFYSCCGKNICNGCEYVMMEREGEKLCAFCRSPFAESDEEYAKRSRILMENGNAMAYHQFAGFYAEGTAGLPQDWAKANELHLKAGELGCAAAYYNLGVSYYIGERGVEVDKKKAMHYLELAAMNGSVHARHNLGALEGQARNPQRAYKHYIISASAGFKESLDEVKAGFMNGWVTKDEYANALRSYQKSQDEMKSEARDKAANSQG